MFSRQDRLLENEDGRYYAIDKGVTGIVMIATEEILSGLNLAFGLPSASALYLNLSRTHYLAYKDIDPRTFFDEHAQGVWPDKHGPLFDFFENFVAHVVFAHTALEAFANESIPRDYEQIMINRERKKVLFSHQDIERHCSLSEKLDKVLPRIYESESPKGSHYWRDYINLKKLRDRIIHLKMKDRSPNGPEQETVWGYMLRNSKIAFCDQVHSLCGYFGEEIKVRYWHQRYPYDHVTKS